MMVHYRRMLLEKKIHPDVIILFGSYAKGNVNKNSDIDIAVVSKKFGKNRHKEGVLLNMLAHEIDSRLEVIPVSLKEYMKKFTTSPILDQIHKTGTVLF